jgi:hypothetical protein
LLCAIHESCSVDLANNLWLSIDDVFDCDISEWEDWITTFDDNSGLFTHISDYLYLKDKSMYVWIWFISNTAIEQWYELIDVDMKKDINKLEWKNVIDLLWHLYKVQQKQIEFNNVAYNF